MREVALIWCEEPPVREVKSHSSLEESYEKEGSSGLSPTTAGVVMMSLSSCGMMFVLEAAKLMTRRIKIKRNACLTAMKHGDCDAQG